MTEESPAKRGEAAWKQEREAISKRNAEAHKRAQGAQRSRDASTAANQREALDREAKQLQAARASRIPCYRPITGGHSAREVLVSFPHSALGPLDFPDRAAAGRE
jgi:hypothetical protein